MSDKIMQFAFIHMNSDAYQISAKLVTDFISKLLAMMKDFPEIIDFNEHGDELVIHDKQFFINNVLQKYFRHNNWRSFIRQLNMYNFKKVNREIEKQIFVHPIFRKGNESKFHLIKRKLGLNTEEKELGKITDQNIQILLEKGFQKYSSPYNFMVDIFNLKTESQNAMYALKKDLDDLGDKKKGKQMKPILQQMRESFQMMEEASQKLFYTIEHFGKKSTYNCQEHSENNFGINFFPLFDQTITNNDIDFLENKKSTTKEEGFEKLQEDRKNSRRALGVTNNCSFSSVASLIN